MVKEDTTGLAGITELYVFTDSFFEGVSVLFKAVENLFVARDIKASVNLLFLGVDVQTNVVRRRAEAKVIPVAGLGFTEIEFLLEVRIGAHLVVEGLPEFEFKPVGLTHALDALHRLGPVVGFLHHVEFGGEEGVVYLPQLNFYEEEADVGIRMLIEPFYSLTMLITCPLDNPDDHFRALSGGVGNQFAQMVMICVLQLVLDYDLATRAAFCGVEVHTETTYGRFAFFQVDVNTNGAAQLFEVCILCEPFGEVVSLVGPYCAQITDALHFTEFHYSIV